MLYGPRDRRLQWSNINYTGLDWTRCIFLIHWSTVASCSTRKPRRDRRNRVHSRALTERSSSSSSTGSAHLSSPFTTMLKRWSPSSASGMGSGHLWLHGPGKEAGGLRAWNPRLISRDDAQAGQDDRCLCEESSGEIGATSKEHGSLVEARRFSPQVLVHEWMTTIIPHPKK